MAPIHFITLILAASLVEARISYTGDVKADFVDNVQPGDFRIVTIQDPSVTPDVGVPNQVTLGRNIISGWDIDSIYFQWNPETDELYIGVDCFEICGDADGLLGPDTASPELLSIGGEDTTDLSGSEAFAIAIDWKNEGQAQHIIGVPGGNPVVGEPLPCASASNAFSSTACAGIYYHARLPTTIAPAFQFLSVAPYTLTNENPSPSAARPDLEWTLSQVSQIKIEVEDPFVNPFEEWQFRINAFAGSFVDAGVGEDYLPDPTNFIEVPFPCSQFDDCDICLGDGSTCLDCAGVPNGPDDYDICDVCGGDGTSCLDCAGEPFGTAVYDVCDVCDGNGDTCTPDCLGVPSGTADYDVCDVCDGDGTSCLDCAGEPNGPADYDVCDVCDGNGDSCLDCLRVPNGGATYDACDVCDGDGTSCFDCNGVANGRATLDVCGICGGDGSSCIDCKGIPLGPHTYDGCDVCGGNGKSCLDCAGVAFGCLREDQCGICGGDGTSCLDCMGIPFGPHIYSDCGKCVPPPLDECKPDLERPLYEPAPEPHVIYEDYVVHPGHHHGHHGHGHLDDHAYLYQYDNLQNGALNQYVHGTKSADGGARSPSYYAYSHEKYSGNHKLRYPQAGKGHSHKKPNPERYSHDRYLHDFSEYPNEGLTYTHNNYHSQGAAPYREYSRTHRGFY